MEKVKVAFTIEHGGEIISFTKPSEIKDSNVLELLRHRFTEFEKQIKLQSVQEYLKKRIGEENAQHIKISFET
ncbi:hypothetical protein [Pontibacillus salipaludis]|uniref:hypothetical protein n=1 Tax=Pontibacillus salipaludis TaxID=1697394 RepID=UPI0031EDE579